MQWDVYNKKRYKIFRIKQDKKNDGRGEESEKNKNRRYLPVHEKIKYY